jgi:hypothetical protein
MPKFRIEQNYEEHGTNVYIVEAKTMAEAIAKVEDLNEEVIDQDVHDFDVINYDGSRKLKKAE